MLKEQDLFLLRILEKVVLANNRQLMVLGGYRDPSVVRKRINSLIKEGYIDSGWLGDHLVYTLSQKGLREIERDRRPYIRGTRSEHEELVTEAACWVYLKGNRSIMDMMFDHELNSKSQFKKLGHKPDLVFSKHQAIEVELNSKCTESYKDKSTGRHVSRLEENFRKNAENFGRQVWIIPRHKQGLRTRLDELAKKYGVEKYYSVVYVEDIIRQVNEFSISENQPRREPVVGVPTPLVRNIKQKEIMEELQ